MNNKKFTLIELIVVIAILGILTSLIVPNISSFKGDATVTAIASNVRNFQTAVDMYSLKNNSEYPTASQPTEFIPEPIDFNKLDKKYLKTLPKTEGVKYWVDFQGRVWASTIDSPQKVTNINGTITWEPVIGAVKYQVFEVEGYKGTIGALSKSKANLVFKGETTIASYNGETGKYYTVNTIDKQNFQSAPAGKDYLGYATQQPISGGVESTPSPLLNKKPVAAITMSQEQALTTTTSITFIHTNSTDEDGDTISQAEWQVDTNPIQTTAPDGTFTEGTHTVKLRVQDSRGLWSDWVSEDFYILNATGVKQIVAGGNHSLALLNNGTVKAWGYNKYGQLGTTTNSGTDNPTTTPITVTGLTNVQSIAAGELFSLALLKDGTVMSWGSNYYGQLGTTTNHGTYNSNPTPITVTGLTNVQSINTGKYHSLAVLTDGTVKAWGWNNYGQLGNGTTTSSTTPVTVTGLTNAQSIEAGEYHTLALLTDGTVKAWGYNGYGQLGNGTTTSSTIPVTGLTDVQSIAADDNHSLAVLNNGTVKAWGYNYYGQLGDGTTTDVKTPITVTGLANVRSVVTGETHSLALLNDGTVKAWGTNSYGQLGDGTITQRFTPTSVTGIINVQSINAGKYHSLAILNDGTVKAWGWNYHGQLGITTNKGSGNPNSTPITVTGISN